jgi:hypothetical protein
VSRRASERIGTHRAFPLELAQIQSVRRFGFNAPAKLFREIDEVRVARLHSTGKLPSAGAVLREVVRRGLDALAEETKA